MPTPKQEKLIKLLVENLGTPNNTKTLGEMLLEAGYSKNQSDNPYQILESETVKEGMKDVVSKMEIERERAIKLLEKTSKKAKYRDLVDGIDKFTKNIQLLTGGDTEKQNISIQISEAIAKKHGIE